MSNFLSIRVDQIVESRWQPREGVGDPAAFEELVANVKVHGVTAPLKAFVNEEGAYELVTGHRRRRAAIKAGLTHVPLIVVAMPKKEAGLRALHEEVIFDNLLHEPLTPLEEARAFKSLQEEGYSTRQIAERLGKSRGYVMNRLDLLGFPEDVQGLVVLRKTTLVHAREIARVKDPDQRAELIEEAKAGASYQEIKAKAGQIVPIRAHSRRVSAQNGKAHTGSQGVHAQPVQTSPPEEDGTCPHGNAPKHCPICQGDGPLPEDEGDELAEEDEETEPRLIPVNGNGKTVYVSVPNTFEEPAPAPRPSRETEKPTHPLPYKHDNPAVGAPTAAGQHCPHCGDGRGRERCNACGRNRWIIAFDNLEDYLQAQKLLGAFFK